MPPKSFKKIGSKVTTMDKIYNFFAFLVILFVGVAFFYWAYKNYVEDWLNRSSVPNKEIVSKYNPNMNKGSDTTPQKEAILWYFYTDWCPHCKNAKPHIDNIKSNYHRGIGTKMINGYKINVIKVNCCDPSSDKCTNTDNMKDFYNKPSGTTPQELMNEYDVQGYPTIKLENLNNGKIYDLDAKPDYDTIETFMKKML